MLRREGGQGATLGTLFKIEGSVFTRGIVSTQRVEVIQRWTKKGRLTQRNKLNDAFDVLMVIAGDLILKWDRLDTRVTTGPFSLPP